MIDTYIHMVVTNCRYISNYCPEKMLDVDLMCPIGIEKTKTKMEAMWHDLPSYAALTRP